MKVNVRRIAIDIVKTLLIAGAILYLADYFGWHVFREAGGGVVHAAF
jgi:hypothetical protein